MHLITGLFIAIIISWIAFRVGALSLSGFITASLVGGILYGLGGLDWAVLLLTFFISSSILSILFRRRKAGLEGKFSKTGKRDWGQVTANAGILTVLVLLHYLFDAPWIWAAATGAVAAVNADTWATEIGVLNPTRPRLITSWRKVDPGTSGGVSLLGSTAALAGAALIGLIASLLSGEILLVPVSLVSGFAGSMIDSFLGATVQVIYYCSTCKKETERHPQHICGGSTTQIRGWQWLNNDWVNILASAIGAATSVILWWLF